MSQFYASIAGNRGEATRQGTKSSGLTGHIRGWGLGAKVEMSHEKGEDVCRVYLTSGSSGSSPSRLIGEYREANIKIEE